MATESLWLPPFLNGPTSSLLQASLDSMFVVVGTDDFSVKIKLL
jgi:hypothetical protein